jgi:hypothetical protein
MGEVRATVLRAAEKDLGGGDEALIVAFEPYAHRYRGIYFHYNRNPQTSHSLRVTRQKELRELADREWMIRAYFEAGEGRSGGNWVDGWGFRVKHGMPR